MPAIDQNELLKQVSLLSRKEQLQLAARILKMPHEKKILSLKWKDLCGVVQYPALGEDAQAWVKRNRQ